MKHFQKNRKKEFMSWSISATYKKELSKICVGEIITVKQSSSESMVGPQPRPDCFAPLLDWAITFPPKCSIGSREEE